METERIALSQRERDRLKVLHEVQQKHLPQIAAAERLKVRSTRPGILTAQEKYVGVRGKEFSPVAQAACGFNCFTVEANSFLPSQQSDGRNLARQVRRAIAGFMPLAIRAS
jgi:hypothetical protein